MNRTIVTLVGKDKVGIIATICNFFAENNINILDIKQTTVQDYINMILIVDTTGYTGGLDELNRGLDDVGERVGCIVKATREEIFEMMHRI